MFFVSTMLVFGALGFLAMLGAKNEQARALSFFMAIIAIVAATVAFVWG